MLEVKNLHVTYGGAVRALQGVTLSVPEGKVVALLGSNGAGKSTLLRCISGTLRLQGGAVNNGTVEVDGHSVLKRDAAKIVSSGVVQVPEGRRIFGWLSVEENLRAGSLGNSSRSARGRLQKDVYEMFPVLADRRTGRAGLLSGGEQQMLAIGRALMAEPRHRCGQLRPLCVRRRHHRLLGVRGRRLGRHRPTLGAAADPPQVAPACQETHRRAFSNER